MGWRRLLLILPLAAIFAFGAPEAALADGCSQQDRVLGLCNTDTSATNGGDRVDVSGSQGGSGNGAPGTSGGSGNGSGNGGSGNGGSGTAGGGGGAGGGTGSGGAPVLPDRDPSDAGHACLVATDPVWVAQHCAVNTPGEPPRAITLVDLASFRPQPPRQQMEPDGWAVAGLDTNFYALTDPHVVDGQLLGRPASVRFTPTRYDWAYGDGSAAALGTKGGTWRQLGLAEFSPTPTSHVYAHEGEYTITLQVGFAAEYRFAGGSWIPVPGLVTLPANELHTVVTGAKTVLVDGDCVAHPGDPGC